MISKRYAGVPEMRHDPFIFVVVMQHARAHASFFLFSKKKNRCLGPTCLHSARSPTNTTTACRITRRGSWCTGNSSHSLRWALSRVLFAATRISSVVVRFWGRCVSLRRKFCSANLENLPQPTKEKRGRRKRKRPTENVASLCLSLSVVYAHIHTHIYTHTLLHSACI